MIRFIFAAVLTLGVSTFAHAGELDNDANATNKQMTGTMVLRVDNRTHASAYMKLDTVLASKQAAQAVVNSKDFKPVPASNMHSELDKEGGASSWYFYRPYPYYNPYYYPSCNWYGNNYNPYYYYSYSYYTYYYYGGGYPYACGACGGW